MVNKDICPKCRFPSRISGRVFINNTNSREYAELEEQRCPLCGHLLDYEIISISPKQVRIIYRNFDNSVVYFKRVRKYLKENGFVLLAGQ